MFRTLSRSLWLFPRPPVETYPLFIVVGAGITLGGVFGVKSLFCKPDVFLTNQKQRRLLTKT